MKYILLFILSFLFAGNLVKDASNKEVPPEEMERIYNEIKTPFKYGVVFKHPDTNKLVDSPTIFRKNKRWYMTYIVFDGKGYETWLSESDDLLNWKPKGKIMAFSENTWDANQKAGYVSLVNTRWEGDYAVEKYQNKYWMTYLGGNTAGYESGTLKIGLATSPVVSKPKIWESNHNPILSPDDDDARWFENKTIYKSLVIRDQKQHTGYPFVMYYNAKGDTARYESIGMAVSDDMVSWKRYGVSPVITKYKGICGDAQIVKINKFDKSLDNLWNITEFDNLERIKTISRKNGDKITENPLRARRTYKLLTGNRFQWIAINIETGEFSGTGGGVYSFVNGNYTENLEFFSRDSSRVGASLNFTGKVENEQWHHSGLSSKGDPIYEIWTKK